MVVSRRVTNRSFGLGWLGVLILGPSLYAASDFVQALVLAMQGGYGGRGIIALVLATLCLVLLGAVGLTLCIRGFGGRMGAARYGWVLAGLAFTVAAIFPAWGLAALVGEMHAGEAGAYGILWLILLAVGAGDLLLLAGLLFRRARARRVTKRWSEWAGRATVILLLWIAASLLTVAAVPQHGDDPHRMHGVECMNQVRNLATLLSERSLSSGWPPHGGKNLTLSLAAQGLIDPRNPDNMEVFVCPACADSFPDARDPAAWAEVTPEGLATRRFPHLTSYAGRRNDDPRYAIPSLGEGPVVAILACAAHEGGVIVGFSDGKTRWMEPADLGLAPGDPIVFGEASKSPLLRALSAE